MASVRVLREFAVTAELTGATFSEPAKRAFLARLDAYPEEQALAALIRCQSECRYRLTLADVVSRIDDGRPGPEEAWSRVQVDERATLVWTDEMRAAYAAAAPLLAENDAIAARMAFLEVYRAEMMRARDQGRPVNWSASLGHDPAGREEAVTQAESVGLLTRDQVPALPPPVRPEDIDEDGAARVREHIAAAKAALEAGAEKAAAEKAAERERRAGQRRAFDAAMAEARQKLLADAAGRYAHLNCAAGEGEGDEA